VDVVGDSARLELFLPAGDEERADVVSSLLARAGRSRRRRPVLVIVGDRGCVLARLESAGWSDSSQEVTLWLELARLGDLWREAGAAPGDGWNMGRVRWLAEVAETVFYVREGKASVPMLARAPVSPGEDLRTASGGVGEDLAAGVWSLALALRGGAEEGGSAVRVALEIGSGERSRRWRGAASAKGGQNAADRSPGRRWLRARRIYRCCGP
jgi:hypothetical protein